MALKKEEMRGHFSDYMSRMALARVAEGHGLYRETVAAAVAAWNNVEGMMQYASKYENKVVSAIAAFEIVLKYAPLLLDRKTLNALEDFLAAHKRLSRREDEDLLKKLTEARGQLRANHRLWAHIQKVGEVRQDELRRELGSEQEYWRWVSESWEHMGLIQRLPDGASYRLSFVTRVGGLTSGKCPKCGEIAQAPKAMLLEIATCPKCRASVHFVLKLTPGTSNART